MAGNDEGGNPFVWDPAEGGNPFVWDSAGRVVHLDRLAGHDSVEVSAINDRGQLVGWSADFSGGFEEVLEQRAVLWGADGSVRDLGVLPGEEDSRAMAINNRGQVVGQSGRRAVLWDTKGSIRELDPLPGAGDEWTGPVAINDVGQVIGGSGDRAVLWDPDGAVRDLSDLAGVEDAAAVAINDGGQVLLNRWNADGSLSAILWDPDTGAQELGGLGKATSYGVAINDRGQVVGTLDSGAAFLWDPARGMRELDVGGSQPTPVDINEIGQVVGWRVNRDNPEDADPEFIGSAFLWDPNLGLIDLAATCEGPSGARALNNHGEVVGWCDVDSSDPQTVVVWSAAG